LSAGRGGHRPSAVAIALPPAWVDVSEEVRLSSISNFKAETRLLKPD
jgi:hypothetical protein